MAKNRPAEEHEALNDHRYREELHLLFVFSFFLFLFFKLEAAVSVYRPVLATPSRKESGAWARSRVAEASGTTDTGAGAGALGMTQHWWRSVLAMTVLPHPTLRYPPAPSARGLMSLALAGIPASWWPFFHEPQQKRTEKGGESWENLPSKNGLG